MSRTKRLQILKNGEWKYVFCISGNAPAGGIITTESREKALKHYDYEYFKSHFGNDEFRIF